MRATSGAITALIALLPLLNAAPLPFRRSPLLGGSGGDGLGLGLGLGSSNGPLDALDSAPVGLAHIVPLGDGGAPLGGLPLGGGGNGGALGIIPVGGDEGSPLSGLPLGGNEGDDGLFGGLPSKLLGRPTSPGTGSGLLDGLLSPLTDLLDPATDSLGDVLDLGNPTKLVCADVGSLLLGDLVEVGVCACLGLGDDGRGMWVGKGRGGPLEGLGRGVGLAAGVNLDLVRDKVSCALLPEEDQADVPDSPVWAREPLPGSHSSSMRRSRRILLSGGIPEA